MSTVTRRRFLAGTAAAGAAMAVPLWPGRTSAAAVTRVSGASVAPQSYGYAYWPAAAKRFDGYIGMPLGVTAQKVYLSRGIFPASPGSQMKQLSRLGCQFLVSVKPDPSTDQSAKLAAYLKMLDAHGISYRVLLWQELNQRQAFQSGASWQAYWSQYAPVVHGQGKRCCYNPLCSPERGALASAWWPADPPPDEVWLDYYGSAYHWKLRIDDLIAKAHDAGIPLGVAEYGYAAEGAPYPDRVWDAYCSYLAGLAPGLPLGGLYWSMVHSSLNTVASATDFKIPGIRRMATALSSGK
jgi:hypothetical protein